MGSYLGIMNTCIRYNNGTNAQCKSIVRGVTTESGHAVVRYMSICNMLIIASFNYIYKFLILVHNTYSADIFLVVSLPINCVVS